MVVSHPCGGRSRLDTVREILWIGKLGLGDTAVRRDMPPNSVQLRRRITRQIDSFSCPTGSGHPPLGPA